MSVVVFEEDMKDKTRFYRHLKVSPPRDSRFNTDL